MKSRTAFQNLLRFILGACLSGLLFFSTGCIKCEECIAADAAGNEKWSAESCGKKSVREEGRTSCEAFAATVEGVECTCVIKKD